MAYSGEILNASGIINIDLTAATVVAVSGDGPNFCGHLLLRAGGRGGLYFHVAEFRGAPRYMTENGYRRYLRELGKTELRQVPVRLPDPGAAMIYLEALMADTWTWLVVPNNCVAFVEEVIAAGGGTWASASNCPSVAVADDIPTRLERFLGRLEREIYGLYAIPR